MFSCSLASRFAHSRFVKPPLAAALGLAALSLLAPQGAAAQTAVLTQNNDNARTGANTAETLLTPLSVSGGHFGKLFTVTGLDANVNGQVLYVPQVSIGGAAHNVLYAYTSNNRDHSPCGLNAFDADTGAALWHTALPLSATYTTAAPVIDSATGTMYVLSKTDNDDTGATFLHAIDIVTGQERPNSPVQVAASVPGKGDGSVNGVVSFDGPASSGRFHANDRPALLLLGGVVYTAYAHNSDSFPYHGWVLGYKYDGTQWTQTAKFCTTPNGGDGGIWQAGKGLTADAAGYIYCSVGNGTFDANTKGITPGTDYGMCYLKLRASDLSVVDWFAPFDEKSLSDADLDLGGGGLVGIPATTRVFAGGTKFGSGFLLDTASLGHFTPGGPDQVPARLDNLTPDDSVGQNPVAWDIGGIKFTYLWARGANLEQFRYDPAVGTFNPLGIFKQSSGLTAGGSLAVTANGTGSGILWAVGGDAVVRAFDATDVSKGPLWTSAQNAGRDALGSVGHFQFPTVVNGKVYVPNGAAGIAVYGLLPGAAVSLAPSADAFIWDGKYRDTNFGTSTALVSKRLSNSSTSSYNRAAYLKFDLTGLSAAPSKATLTLTVSGTSNPASGTETVRLYSVADTSWTETGLTWNTAPGLNTAGFSSTGSLLTTQAVPLKAGTVTFDVTAFVKANLGKAVTFQLLDPYVQNLYLAFNSREAASGKPQLSLTP